MQKNYIIEIKNTILMIDRKEFEKFIGSIKSKGFLPETVLNYSQQISEHDYKSLIKGLINNKENSFYWSQPNEVFSFLAYKEVLSFPLNSAELKNKFLKGFTKRIYSNQNAFLKLKQPLFIGGMKFPSSKNDSIWKDFDSEKWFIPKVLLLNINDEYSITFNFMSDIYNIENIDDVISHLTADLKFDSERLNDLEPELSGKISPGS